MKRHDVDWVSLIAGGVFLLIATTHLVGAATDARPHLVLIDFFADPILVAHFPRYAGAVLGEYPLDEAAAVEAVVDVNTKAAPGKVTDVAQRGADGVAAAEELLDRLRLGGRLDDD